MTLVLHDKEDREKISIDGVWYRLEGRHARCCTDESIMPSSTGLAFFQYRGPGMAAPSCSVGKCFYVESVHQPINPHTGRPGITDHDFAARTYEYDLYYCGCRGWD